MFTGKRLLILGGSKISCEIVREAKKLGIYTVVTDWYPLEMSPAKKIADKNYEISTTDLVGLKKLINDESIDGILTGFTDSALIPYAKICKEVNLPCYGSEELFELFTDKKRYKQKFEDYAIPTIKEIKLEDKELLREEDLPLLIKPVDGSGSKGISICKEIAELDQLIKKAKSNSKKKEVILEKYVEGKEMTAFFLFENGKILLSCTGDRHMSEPQDEETLPLPVGYTFPSIQEENFKKNIFPKLVQIFEDEKIENGMMFMQCKIDKDTIYIYDVGYRLTGSLEYKIQEKIQGINPLTMLIRFSLTGKMRDKEKINEFNKIGLNVSLLTKVGYVLDDIEGIDNLLDIDGIIDVIPAKEIGQKIDENIKGTLAQIAVRILAYADNRKELEELINKINNEIKLISVTGKNMNLTNIDIADCEEELVFLEKIYG